MARRNFIARLVRRTSRRLVSLGRGLASHTDAREDAAIPESMRPTSDEVRIDVPGKQAAVSSGPSPLARLGARARPHWMASLKVFRSFWRVAVPQADASAWSRMPSRWPRWLPWLGILALAWAWWATASSTAIARVAALQTVEPYAFAVHDQLVRNFSATGEFFQTVHKGYDNAWTWSGHRALTLIGAGWLYQLDPSAFGLSRFMVGAFLLGVVPAALIGRRVTRGAPVGLWLGALAYLGSPTLMALSLQDYQDLCMAAPALVFCWWAMGARRFWWAPLGTFIGMAPREECIPMVVGVAVLSIPVALSGRVRWGRWVWNVLAAVAVAATYVWWAETYFPVATSGHDMPLENAVKGFTGGTNRDIFLDGWTFLQDFYVDLLLPFGFVALLGVEGLLPAAGLVLLHMTVPVGHGVDRSWSGHAHHMAPAVAFISISVTLAVGRLLRWTSPRQRNRRLAWHWGCALLLTVVAWNGWQPFAESQNFRITSRVRTPEWVHPAWRLARKVPADGVPIASKDVSPAISSFAESYTYDGSLPSKAKMEGLAAGTHMIVDTRLKVVQQWAMAMDGAKLVARDEPFVLIAWNPGSLDTKWSRMRDARMARPPPYSGGYNVPSQIPGVPPKVGGQKIEGIVPRLRLPWMK